MTPITEDADISKNASHYINGISLQAPKLKEVADLLSSIKNEGDNAFLQVNQKYYYNGKPNNYHSHKDDYYIKTGDKANEWRSKTSSALSSAENALRRMPEIIQQLHASEDHLTIGQKNAVAAFSEKLALAVTLLESAATDHKTWQGILPVETMREAKRAADYLKESIQPLVGDGKDMTAKLTEYDDAMVKRTATFSEAELQKLKGANAEQLQKLTDHDFVTGVAKIVADEKYREIKNPEQFVSEEKQQLRKLYQERMAKSESFRQSEEAKAANRGGPSELA